MKRQVITIVSLMLLLIGLSSCGNDLSRGKAASLIEEAYQFPKPESIAIQKSYIKKSWNDPSNFPAICFVTDDMKYSNVSIMLDAMQSKQLIAIVERTTKSGECNFIWADVALTDEGRKYLMNETDQKLVVRTAEIALNEITGIQMNEQSKTAVADFTLKRINITPFATDNVAAPSGGQVMFSLFDDGWRINKR
jgi:hypothetical protein